MLALGKGLRHLESFYYLFPDEKAEAQRGEVPDLKANLGPGPTSLKFWVGNFSTVFEEDEGKSYLNL